MTNLVLLIACFLLGMLMRRLGRFPDNAPSVLNAFIINISLPALTLLYVHELPLDRSLAYPTAMAWILFALGAIFFVTFGRAAGWSRGTIGGLILVGGLANTSFLGLPMIETFYGEEHLGLGILIDQLGTYMVLSTLGILIAVTYAAGAASPAAIARKILRLPTLPGGAPGAGPETLRLPGGARNRARQARRDPGATRPGLGRLSAAARRAARPARRALRRARIQAGDGPGHDHGPVRRRARRGRHHIQVTIFEAAMAPMIGASIVAIEHKLDPPLVTLMVGIGIPLSFLTLPVWWYVLQGV